MLFFAKISKWFTNLFLIVFGESFINAIEVYKKSKWEKVEKSTFKTRWAAFRLNINFDDRVEKVNVSFRDNLADDYIIDVKYHTKGNYIWLNLTVTYQKDYRN